MPVASYKAFEATKYWPALDGLRIISIVLVLITHMGDRWVQPFNGSLGVVLFFVISGFLITSLLLREEIRRGTVSLWGFYIRRFFRIAPLYYLGLTTAAGLVLIGGFGDSRATFLERLPLLATFNGELASTGTFVHSWSLGIEEKFYIVWPLIAFGSVAAARWRRVLAPTLLAFCTVAAFLSPVSYFGMYTGILAGCVLALVMHSPAGYRAVALLARPAVALVLLAAVVVLFAIDFGAPWNAMSDRSHAFFAVAVALCFPAILIGDNPVSAFLAWRPMRVLGTRTYGIYLFHPFCIDVLNRVIPDGQTSAVVGMIRLVLAFALSCAVAEVLHRSVELPAIAMGRRLTHSAVPSGRITALERT